MSGSKDLGVDVSRARFWANAQLTIEIPMPDKDVVERALGYVPIVRCGACRRWSQLKVLDPAAGWCERMGNFCAADFFCRDGVKNEEGKT